MDCVETHIGILESEVMLVITLSSYSWSEPSLDLNKFPTKPSKTIGPPGKLEGNTTHIMYRTVSLEIVLWVTAKLKCLHFGIEWGSMISFHILRP